MATKTKSQKRADTLYEVGVGIVCATVSIHDAEEMLTEEEYEEAVALMRKAYSILFAAEEKARKKKK